MLSRTVCLIAMSAIAALLGCRAPINERAPVLLFDGKGSSPGSVRALEAVMRNERIEYSKVDSRQVDEISEAQLLRHRLLIVPGGNFVEMGNGLSAPTAAKIRRAVEGGLNYLGVCAGAFIAGNSPFNGFNLTSGVRFRFYSAEDRGIHKTAVAVMDAEGRTLDHYWEDGPQLAGWGAVVAKYPDGTPAIVEGAVGNGWVILTGIHAEADESWRRGMDFKTPVSAGQAYAAKLIRAAVNREQLPHF